MSSRARRRRRREEEQSEIVFAADGVTLEAGDGESSSPSADVLAYTGGKLALANFPHPAVINLAGNVRAMEMRDRFGQSTQIVFENLRTGVIHDPRTFRFEPPPGVDVYGVGG